MPQHMVNDNDHVHALSIAWRHQHGGRVSTTRWLINDYTDLSHATVTQRQNPQVLPFLSIGDCHLRSRRWSNSYCPECVICVHLCA